MKKSSSAAIWEQKFATKQIYLTFSPVRKCPHARKAIAKDFFRQLEIQLRVATLAGWM